MTRTHIEYRISEMMGTPETLTIEENGSVRYESHTNAAEHGAVPVGTFATVLSPADVQALRVALVKTPFNDLPDHWGKIAAGERYKAIRLVGPSGAMEKRIGTTRAVAAETQMLFEEMDKIVRSVRAHPLENLMLRLSELVLDARGRLRATMTLSNPGTIDTVCRSPARPGAGLRCSFRAVPDRDPLSIRSTDVVETESLAIRSRGLATGELLALKAGSDAAFDISAELMLPPNGRYLAQVIYQNTTAEFGGTPLADVEIYSTPKRLES